MSFHISSTFGAVAQNTSATGYSSCLACRSRKVRCDVIQNYPCGNCRWNHHDCVIYSRRTKASVNKAFPSFNKVLLTFFRRHAQTAAECARNQADEAPSLSPKSRNQSIPSFELPREPGKESTQRLEQESNQQNNGNQGKQRQHLTEVQGTQDLKRPDQPAPCLSEALMAETDHLPLCPEVRNKQPALAIPETRNLHGSPLEVWHFPHAHALAESRSWCLRLMSRFVKALPTDMAVEDMEFLQSKGALTIPDTKLREALIQAYLEHVHPLLPVINIEDFIESLIEDNDFNAKVSLLFLQAVMFSGSAYVDWCLLAEAGFKTRKEARSTLYQRARVRISVRKKCYHIWLMLKTAFVPI